MTQMQRQLLSDLDSLIADGNPVGVDAYLFCLIALGLDELSDIVLLLILLSTDSMKHELESRSQIYNHVLRTNKFKDTETLERLKKLKC